MTPTFKFLHYVRLIVRRLTVGGELPQVQLSATFCKKIEEILFVVLMHFMGSIARTIRHNNRKTVDVADVQLGIYTLFPLHLRALVAKIVDEKIKNFETTTTGSHVDRANLTVPPSKCRRIFKSTYDDLRLSKGSPVAIAAMIEVVVTETMSLALKKSQEMQIQRMGSQHLDEILDNNLELSAFVNSAYAWVGVVSRV